MDSVSKNSLGRNIQPKERKLSLSNIRKIICRKTNQSNDSTSTIVECYCKREDKNPLSNGQLTTDCHCQRTQQDKSRKNILKNWKKKMHLSDSLLIWQPKQKVKASESTDESCSKAFVSNTYSKENTSLCPVQFARPACDNSVLSRVPDITSVYQSSNNETVSPLIPPRKIRPDDLVLVPMEGSVAPEDSPFENSNSMKQLEPRPSNGKGVSKELINLSHEGWYWGPISRQEAEDKLRGQPDGTFLVRDSTSNSYLFTISFRSSGKTLHSRIDYNYGKFSLYSSMGFTSIAELIRHSMTCSKGAIYCYSQPNSPTQPEFPVRLTNPLSRFMQVRSLQYLCRFVIRQYTGLADIQKLPLPAQIKGYIEEGHY